MPVVTPPTVAPLPTAPDPNNRATFDLLAYPFTEALDPWADQVTAVGENVFDNATDAATSATNAAQARDDAEGHADDAAASAAAAASTAGAGPFVSGQAYAQYAAAISTIDLQTYRRNTAGSSATDPSLDPVNWTILGTDPDTLLPFANLTALAQIQATALSF